MPTIITLISLVAVAGGVLFSGCSQSTNPTATPGSSANSSAAAGNDAVDLRIRWVPGKKYAMRLDFTQSMESKSPNQSPSGTQEVKLAQDLTYWALQPLTNGGQELELLFGNMTMAISQGGRNVLNFDSTQSPGSTPAGNEMLDTMVAVLRAMKGGRVQYFTDAGGNVEKVVDGDLMKRVAATGKSQAPTLFKQQLFNDETLKRYGSFGDMMPNRTVKVGESWLVNKDFASNIGTLATKIKYTFKNWELHGDRKCAHIEYAGDILSKSISAAAAGAAVEVEKGKDSGEMWFDPELGMIVDSNSNQKLTLKVTTRQQSGKQQLTQVIRLLLVDVE